MVSTIFFQFEFIAVNLATNSIIGSLSFHYSADKINRHGIIDNEHKITCIE